MELNLMKWLRFTVKKKVVATTAGALVLIDFAPHPRGVYICRAGFKNSTAGNNIAFEWGIYQHNEYYPLNTKTAGAATVVADIGEFILDHNKKIYVNAVADTGTIEGLIVICGASEPDSEIDNQC